MAKKFAPRVSKKERKVHDLSDRLARDLLSFEDNNLLKDAQLSEIKLGKIKVKEQVRTKFNDKSLKDLGDNIRENGLIQPLVVHKEGTHFVLICGERRFRAMSLIKKETAPCFIISNKTDEELMAIQFSENSSREELHYIDKADGILNYQEATKASERKIQKALGISKSEVHRSLLIAKLPTKLKVAAKNHNIEKYVLLELDAFENKTQKTKLEARVVKGEITKRAELKKAIADLIAGRKTSSKKKTVRRPAVPRGTSANAFIKAMATKSAELGLDKKTEKLLKQLMNDTKKALD